MLRIDGAHGEGGGQILRSALTLSILTGRPMEIYDIRAGRKRPGLMPQHLKAVQAAAAISGASVEGAREGSTALSFRPGPVAPGRYRFDIGTAGSAPLVLQTILLPLALAGAPSHVAVVGGTHVPHSPCFHYLERQWLPWLRRMGAVAEAWMPRAGFYPRGGGVLEAAIGPASSLAPLRLTERGPLRRIRVLSLVGRLPPSIAERQARAALNMLSSWRGERETVYLDPPSAGPGTMLFLEAEFEGAGACFFALGARGKPAEEVGAEAARELDFFLRSDAAVEEHGADQLVLPLSVAAGESVCRTSRVTRHLQTVLWVTRHFLPADIDLEGELGEPGTVRIGGAGPPPSINP